MKCFHTRRPSFFQQKKFHAVILYSLLSSVFMAMLLIGTAFSLPPEAALPPLPNFSEGTGGQEDDLPAFSRTDGIYTGLFLGKDTVGDNTDVIMLASFHVKEGKISILQIPRDTYLRYRGRGIKLGTLYSRLLTAARKEGEAEASEAALEGVKSLLEEYLSIPIDFYLLLDLNAVCEAVDTMDGVVLDVPFDMDYEDPAQGLSIHLKAGKQRLDGQKAVQFVRFRAGYVTADIGRLDAQKLFLSALWQRAKSPAAIAGLLSKLPSMLERIETNAKLSDALYFLGQLSGVKNENLTMATARGLAIQSKSGTWFYVLNRAAFLADLNRMICPYADRLTDEMFDIGGVFTDETDAEINQIYRSPIHQFEESEANADEILESGLYIPLLPSS
jgi:LCP family protein required for cell wall assembly